MQETAYSLAAMVMRYVLAGILMLILIRLVNMARYDRRIEKNAAAEGLPTASYLGMLVREDRRGDGRYGLGPDNIIGRSRRCDITIRDVSMAPIHAQIYLRKDGFYLYGFDLKGRIQINGEQKSGRVPIVHGDVIRLGNILLRVILFRQEEEDEAADSQQPGR